MRKKHMIIFVCGVLSLSYINTIYANNFEGRESEMNNKCATITDTDTQKECREYKAYLENKSKNLDQEISDIQKQIVSVKGNVDDLRKFMQSNQKQIAKYEKEAAGVQLAIDKTVGSIAKLDMDIKQKSEDIVKRDALMKARLVEMQPYIGSNNYVDFIMGASSFVDLLRRAKIIGDLNTYDNDQIMAISKEKKKVALDLQIIEEQKSLLEIQKKSVKDNKERVVALNRAKATLLNEYQRQEVALTNQKRTAQMAQVSIPKIDLELAESFDKPTNENDNTDDGNSNDNNGNGGNDTGGNDEGTKPNPTPPNVPNHSFIVPLARGTWHYEAGTWRYPGGAGHMGMDFSTGSVTGIPVVAPADGIVLYSYNGGCDNNGYSSCGIPSGGGNNTLLLTKKGNTIYAMPFYHLTSATKSANTRVKQGDIIGYSGNSGNSTGPHTHVEVIRVGDISMAEAIKRYNTFGDLTFGTGWDAERPKSCGFAPCRERPESYWK